METQEHCQKCQQKDREKALFEGFCERCFGEVIEKRVRKHVRLSGLIKKNDVLVVDHPLVAYFVKSIVQDMPVTILEMMPKDCDAKQVVALTMDDELDAFLDQIFAGKDLVVEAKREQEQHTQQIKLLVTLTDKEAVMFAQAKQIEPLPKKTRKYEALLQQLEQKHQETRYSLMKSVEALKKILNKTTPL